MVVNCIDILDHQADHKFLKQLTIAFGSYDLETVGLHLYDDFSWTLIGDQPIYGKENFLEALSIMKTNLAVQLDINKILIDRPYAAIQGVMHMQNGDKYSFSDFYEMDFEPYYMVISIQSFVLKME